MIHVGIDLNANNMVIVATGGNGTVAKEAKLPTATRALADFLIASPSPFGPWSNTGTG